MNIFQEISLALKARKFILNEITEAKTMNGIKPGWKTTEFYLNILAQAASWAPALAGYLPAKYAAISSVVLTTVYTIARLIQKAVADVQAAKAGTPAVGAATSVNVDVKGA